VVPLVCTKLLLFQKLYTSADHVSGSCKHSDVKFHEFFWREMFHEIFPKIF